MENHIQTLTQKAAVLIEALPYIRRFQGAVIVIKYGGNAMVDETLKQCFAEDVTLLKYVGFKPVVVHGGGPQINDLLKRLDIQSHFVQGQRFTDQATMEVVEMVLSGHVGQDLVGRINRAGGLAVGLSGKDARLIEARRKSLTRAGGEAGQSPETIDIGLVGEPVRVNVGFLRHLADGDVIPVIAPVGWGAEGETFNINADSAAGALAGALKAEKLILLTDVEGVLDRDGQLIVNIRSGEIEALKSGGAVSGGMIPKLDCAAGALAAGCRGVYIVDGRRPHALLLELFTDQGCGTEVRP
jgi:acetylglutamate kinase